MTRKTIAMRITVFETVFAPPRERSSLPEEEVQRQTGELCLVPQPTLPHTSPHFPTLTGPSTRASLASSSRTSSSCCA